MRYLIAGVLIFLFIKPEAGHCQTHLDCLLTDSSFAIGDSLQRNGHYQEAIASLEQAAAQYQQAQHWQDYFYTENKICENLWRLGQYDTAWQLVQKVQRQSTKKLGEENEVGIYTCFNIAFLHHIYGRYDEALSNYHHGLAIAQRYPDSYPLLDDDLYHGASISYAKLRKYDTAIVYCRRGLAIRKEQQESEQVETAKSYAQMGLIHVDLGNRDSSLWYNQKALAIQLAVSGEYHAQAASYHMYVGRSYFDLTIYDSAAYHYRQALAGYKHFLGEEHYYTALSRGVLGNIYYEQGNYLTARSYYLKAINTFTSLFGQEHQILRVYYSALGTTYSKIGEHPQAIQSYRRALNISNATGDEDVQQLYVNLGDSHANLLQYDSALLYSRRALAVGKRLYGSKHYGISTLYHAMGDIFRKQAQYDSALQYYHRALAVWNDHRITRHPELALLYQEVGNVYRAQSDYESARAYYEKSVRANHLRQNKLANTDSQQHMNNEVLLSTINAQAQTMQAYYEQTNDLTYLAQAFNFYLQYDSLISQLQVHRYHQEDQLLVQRMAKKVYEAALSVGMLLYQITRDTAYWQAMFRLAEQSRTIALRSTISNGKFDNFNGILASVVQQERGIKLKKAQYQSLLREAQQASDTAQTQRYHTILLDLDQQYDSLTTTLKKDYPRYYQLKYNKVVITVAELQQELAASTIVLEYFVGDSVGYVFAITPESFQVISFSTDTTLKDQINQLRATVQPRTSQASYQTFIKLAADLYQQLVQPAVKALDEDDTPQHLLVIPDGILSLLPFELLLTETATSQLGEYNTLPYLIHCYGVNYSYSATWQFHERVPPSSGKDLSYLAIAPTFVDKEELAYGALRNKIAPLKWNQAEVAGLGTYLSGNVLTGVAATEQAFKQEAGQYSILHLATHTLINNEQPDRSSLVFAPPTDSTEDGLLRIHEIYALELPAQLAVLSACNTGTGRLDKGEGVMSLARAFAYAGCPSIVMSQWAVDDRATAQLIGQFYEHLAQGLSKDEALRRAKLSLLTSEGATSNPFYWAGFTVVGDVSPLIEKPWYNNALIYLLVGGGSVLVVILAVRGRILRKKPKVHSHHVK